MNLTKSEFRSQKLEVVFFTGIIPITKSNATLQLYIKSKIMTKVFCLFLTIINRSVLIIPTFTFPPNPPHFPTQLDIAFFLINGIRATL
ncbi:MAG: hypothetical protein F6K22_16665 [Okeania sp. SIO2F4]|uniref:hypothetical protein n=1 Tax=Okeania sp. SIO2F4 TaxID=2607790 RepID=UPI00142931C3|nr:hypothetical protein [Okeania sp. SIO2F4]NES04318.1 hypothetical protein [Okeania sp. SIO2F4]